MFFIFSSSSLNYQLRLGVIASRFFELGPQGVGQSAFVARRDVFRLTSFPLKICDIRQGLIFIQQAIEVPAASNKTSIPYPLTKMVAFR
ncbi:hypothetical protein MHH37_01915 [Solibacillus sp. FSL K6-1781]|uniref:hypothetical protein n=1 Tax=Solibacillus sp. FSL K6-1781 TaxID=2921474 RepID=UPI00315A52C2